MFSVVNFGIVSVEECKFLVCGQWLSVDGEFE
jgi:hypothetical protein